MHGSTAGQEAWGDALGAQGLAIGQEARGGHWECRGNTHLRKLAIGIVPLGKIQLYHWKERAVGN